MFTLKISLVFFFKNMAKTRPPIESESGTNNVNFGKLKGSSIFQEETLNVTRYRTEINKLWINLSNDSAFMNKSYNDYGRIH